MAGTAGLDWIWYAAGTLLGIAGLVLLVWALCWDRSKGRTRCPKCWYDMQGAEAHESGVYHCPECGKTITRERKLHKTRRRWRWALPAFVLLIGGIGATVTPKARRDGILSLVPNAALPRLLIFADNAEGPIGWEISGRVSQGRFTPDQMISLYQKLAHGDFLARPVSEQWRLTYGRLIRTMDPPTGAVSRVAGEEPQETPEEIREILMDIPPMLEFRTRPVWPEGVPLHMEVRSDHWWPRPFSHMALIYPPNSEQAVSFSHGHEGHNIFEAWWANPDNGEVRIKYRIQRHGGPDDNQEYEAGIATVPVRFAGTIEEQLTPIRDPVMTEALASSLRLVAQRLNMGRLVLVLRNAGTKKPLFRDVAIAGILEFSADGQVWAEVPAWWTVKQSPFGFLKLEESETLPLREFLNEDESYPPPVTWTVRFRSDPEIALRVIDADTYWEGEVDVPVEVREP